MISYYEVVDRLASDAASPPGDPSAGPTGSTDDVLRPSAATTWLGRERSEQAAAAWAGLRDRDAVLEAGEIYLELSELDLDNEEAIVAFANRWGPLAISYGRDYRLLRPLPGFDELSQQLEAGPTSQRTPRADVPASPPFLKQRRLPSSGSAPAASAT